MELGEIFAGIGAISSFIAIAVVVARVGKWQGRADEKLTVIEKVSHATSTKVDDLAQTLNDFAVQCGASAVRNEVMQKEIDDHGRRLEQHDKELGEIRVAIRARRVASK